MKTISLVVFLMLILLALAGLAIARKRQSLLLRKASLWLLFAASSIVPLIILWSAFLAIQDPALEVCVSYRACVVKVDYGTSPIATIIFFVGALVGSLIFPAILLRTLQGKGFR